MPSTQNSPPFEAYKGTEPYIFISYAHRDSAVVFPDLVRMQALGCNIWYDEGIDPGNEWPDEIANALRQAAYFIFYVSPRSVGSVNCRNEVYFALEQKKPFLSIYIEETNITEINAGLGLSIGSLQAVMKYQMDEASYERKLAKTLGKLTGSASALPVATLPPVPTAATPTPVKKPGSLLLPVIIGGGVFGVIVLALESWYINYDAALRRAMREASHYTTSQPWQATITPQPVLGTPLQPVAPTSPLIDATRTINPPIATGPKEGQPWQNSLGMKFAPAGTPGVLFSTYITRLQDFQAFVTATGYTATPYCYSCGDDLVFKAKGDTWQSPGFTQGSDSPVVGISWDDANAFCNWLTNKEHGAGLLAPNQSYRLPTDAEFSTALATTSTYPWGETWPPPENAGNYLREGDGFSTSQIQNKDGFKYTSPVGSFPPNKYGLYDMNGNAFEWCQDWYRKEMNTPDTLAKSPIMAQDAGGMAYRVVRGGAWVNCDQVILETSFHSCYLPTGGGTGTGFRCVLVTK